MNKTQIFSRKISVNPDSGKIVHKHKSQALRIIKTRSGPPSGMVGAAGGMDLVHQGQHRLGRGELRDPMPQIEHVSA